MINKQFYLILFLILVLCSQSFTHLYGQNDVGYSWWNKKHNWHIGDEPWFRQMTTSSAYFGPNALPIPDAREGVISPNYKIELRPEAHISNGDNTFNLYTSIQIPFKGIASFEAFLVPIEYYSLDTITRDERRARNYDAKGIAGGDFWFGTNFQIIKNRKIIPDIILSAYFKTASGTKLSDARYTDAPAYYLLLNFGKQVYQNEAKKFKIRLFASAGTYIWQTQSNINTQDDAFAYSAGAKLQRKNIYLRIVYAGYYGYLNNGDRPSVLRLQLGSHKQGFNWSLRYQYGLTDFDYSSIGVGLMYNIPSYLN